MSNLGLTGFYIGDVVCSQCFSNISEDQSDLVEESKRKIASYRATEKNTLSTKTKIHNDYNAAFLPKKIIECQEVILQLKEDLTFTQHHFLRTRSNNMETSKCIETLKEAVENMLLNQSITEADELHLREEMDSLLSEISSISQQAKHISSSCFYALETLFDVEIRAFDNITIPQVNGLRISRSANIEINLGLEELNEGWGQASLLLTFLSNMSLFESNRFQVVPLGQDSRILRFHDLGIQSTNLHISNEKDREEIESFQQGIFCFRDVFVEICEFLLQRLDNLTVCSENESFRRILQSIVHSSLLPRPILDRDWEDWLVHLFSNLKRTMHIATHIAAFFTQSNP